MYISQAKQTSTAQCPRCGYDLRGEIATWLDTCPMNGRCAECGLAFEWRAIFATPAHPWLFESWWRRRPIRSAACTIAHCFAPAPLWRSIQLTDPIVIPAQIAIVLIAWTFLPVFAPLANGFSFWRWRVHWLILELFREPLEVFGELAEDVAEIGSWMALIGAPGLIAALTMAALILALRSSRRIVAVRAAHVVRIRLYGLVAPGFITGMWVAGVFVWSSRTNTYRRPSVVLNPFDLDWSFAGYLDFVAPAAVAAALWLAWLGAWWNAALRDYLRFPHRFGVLAAQLIIAAILTLFFVMTLLPLYV